MTSPSPSLLWIRYLRWMLTTLVAVVAAVGAFNVFIDPLGVFPSPRVAGVNAIKPYLDHHRELARYQRANQLCPDTGFFGNSRAEIGFDPENPVVVGQGLKAFNHAIPGAGLGTIYRQFLWLQGLHCFPKTILLGVEFFDFLGGPEPRSLPTLQTAPPPRLDGRFFAESVFSLTGLRDSLATVMLQGARYPATITQRGFNPLYTYVPEVQQSGHYILFRQRAEENARNWARKPRRIHPLDGGSSDDEATLDAILAIASQADSTTYLIIYPYHAQIRMMMERLGMGELFSDWKRLVVAIAQRAALRGGKVEVWDFSGVAPQTLEAIPPKGDRKSQLNYYWEAGHFKRELGNLVIERVMGKPSDFGIKLDAGNLESWLAEDRRRVQSLLATPSALLDEVDDVLAQRARD